MWKSRIGAKGWGRVSVLFNEPKLLKYYGASVRLAVPVCFSALQRAEIAEMAEPGTVYRPVVTVSVLFNEPKLLKW